MKVERLNNEKRDPFISFCKRHREKVDESYLYNEHLHSFQPDDENPTYIISNEHGEVVAAASLIIDEYHRRGNRGRFRIFYSEIEDTAYYKSLMDAILAHAKDLGYVFIFIQIQHTRMIDLFDSLHFSVERYSYILRREGAEAPEYIVPDGYEIRPYQPGRDEEAWCTIRNAAFSNLKGSETPVSPEMVKKMTENADYIEGGLMLLYHKDDPVGIIRGWADEFEDCPAMCIGPVAILPEYQGKGLGRLLLRASIRFGIEKNYSKFVLSVNAENEKAKELYIQEGFEQVEAVACYRYDIR